MTPNENTETPSLFFVAPGFPNENAFYCRFFANIGDYIDEDNRRLHEVDFRGEVASDGYVQCRFRDNRKGFLINKGAMHQIAVNWADIVAGLRYFVTLAGRKRINEPILSRAWRISISTMFAPAYLLLRRDAPISNGRIPSAVAGLFKIMLDVPTTIDLMLMSFHYERATTLDASEIRVFADTNLILLNGEYACAGSPALMDNILIQLLAEGATAEHTPGIFSEYFTDEGEFLDFAYHMSCQYVLGVLFQLTTGYAMEFAFRRLAQSGTYTPPMVTSENENLTAYERRRRFALAALRRADDPTKVLVALSQLVEDPSDWSLPHSMQFDLTEFIDQSSRFLQLSTAGSPQEILIAYRAYENDFRSMIHACQRRIENALGASAIFQLEPYLGPTKELPSSILSQYLEPSGK